MNQRTLTGGSGLGCGLHSVAGRFCRGRCGCHGCRGCCYVIIVVILRFLAEPQAGFVAQPGHGEAARVEHAGHVLLGAASGDAVALDVGAGVAVELDSVLVVPVPDLRQRKSLIGTHFSWKEV